MVEVEALGVGGSVLLMKACFGLVEGDRVRAVFGGIGRRGLRVGRMAAGMLVWIFRGEGVGAGRGVVMVAVAKFVVDDSGSALYAVEGKVDDWNFVGCASGLDL
jgi:hypothetical protein